MQAEVLEDEFTFSDEIEKQHRIIVQYLELQVTIDSIKECEFYFRRYPFRGLPIARHHHITNVCEMYFGRFYEFKERLKRYFNAMAAVTPNHQLDFGSLVKYFAKVFDQELRARNRVHHHRRFEDVAIDRVFLTHSVSTTHEIKSWKKQHLAAYRKLAKEWVQRVRQRGQILDEFLEAVAAVTLANCSFLRASRLADATSASNRRGEPTSI